MTEMIVAIQDMLRKYMSPKPADTVICVIIGSFLIGVTTALIVRLCISTLACRIIYGIIVGIIALSIISFIIHIWTKNYESPSSHQGNESEQRPTSDEADGHSLMVRKQSPAPGATGSVIGVHLIVGKDLNAKVGNINVEGGDNVSAVDIHAKGNANIETGDVTALKTKKNENN